MDDLKAILHTSLQLNVSESIDENRPLSELGLDSITGVSFIATINATYSLSLKASVIFSYPTLKALHDRIFPQQQGSQTIQAYDEDLFVGEVIDE